MRFASLAVILFASSCSDDGKTVAADAASLGPGPCLALEGKTFASKVDGECGLGPNGPVLCTWHLVFSAKDATASHFEWQHSDYGESNDVTCEGTIVKGKSSAGGGGTYDGSWDETSATLHWDGVEYQ